MPGHGRPVGDLLVNSVNSLSQKVTYSYYNIYGALRTSTVSSISSNKSLPYVSVSRQVTQMSLSSA